MRAARIIGIEDTSSLLYHKARRFVASAELFHSSCNCIPVLRPDLTEHRLESCLRARDGIKGFQALG